MLINSNVFIHSFVELTEFFYCIGHKSLNCHSPALSSNDCLSFPVPSANLYVVVNPVRLMMDYLTVLWLNAFTLNLLKKAVS